jgi:ABC-2 type transport system ATP-binding protein
VTSDAIVIEHFSKRYPRRDAVLDLSLSVRAGSIFGLLGCNGAGKSTTIRALLGLTRPTSGTLRVLGMEAPRDAVRIRDRVGYVPEDPPGYPWMTVSQALAFHASFHPRWDHSLADGLRDRLALPAGTRLRDLSRGMRAKVGLVMALGARPELLVLDDPTSGLDPIVRREFLEAVIANVQAEGGTVFFSSHLLDEMERIADEVAILRDGRLAASGPLERLKSATRTMRAVYAGDPPARVELPGLLRCERSPHHLTLTVSGYEPRLADAVRATGALSVDVEDMSLEEIFVATVKGGAA